MIVEAIEKILENVNVGVISAMSLFSVTRSLTYGRVPFVFSIIS